MVAEGWQIVEEASYRGAVERLGGARNCDEALAPILHALHRNPAGFLEVEGVKGGIRIAKTKIKVSGRSVLPAMRLWFRIQFSNRTVYLLYVEACPPDAMLYSEEWW